MTAGFPFVSLDWMREVRAGPAYLQTCFDKIAPKLLVPAQPSQTWSRVTDQDLQLLIITSAMHVVVTREEHRWELTYACLPQVLDSTLPTAHVISRNYRPSAPTQSAGASPGRHVGYLPQVDDLLGLHPDAKTQEVQSTETDPSSSVHPSGQVDNQDPFAASSQALRMKSDSIALSAAQQQGIPKSGGPFSKGKPPRCFTRHEMPTHGHMTVSQSLSPMCLRAS